MGDPVFWNWLFATRKFRADWAMSQRTFEQSTSYAKNVEKTLQFFLCKRVGQISLITVIKCNEMSRLKINQRLFRTMFKNKTHLSEMTTVHWRVWSHFCCQVYCAVKKHFDDFFRVLLFSIQRNFFAIATPLNAKVQEEARYK